MPREKVLIVDDEKDVLDLCRRILETQGYAVKISNNSFEAINIARQEQFDLLLTDIKMPGMTGLEVARILKEHDPNMICVTMTGYSTMDMAVNAVKLGIEEFILKPFTPKELSDSVAKALDKVRLKRENFRLNSLIPLFELNKNLMGTVDAESILDHLTKIAQQETKASFIGFHLVEKDGLVDYPGCRKKTICLVDQLKASKKFAQLALEEGRQLVLTENDEKPQKRDLLAQLESTSAIATLLKSQKADLGVLVLAHQEGSFAPSDSEFLSVLCGQAGIALENARLFSEIQEAYKQLQILDHMKSEFINIAAHELRTPLAILIGYASVLEEETENTHKTYVTNIIRNAMRLRSLIEDMLNLQYLESGIGTLSHDELNLKEAIEEILQDISLLIDEKKLQVENNISTDFPQMIVDRQKFDLILMNLIHNAVKFTPSKGKISFHAEVVGDNAKVLVNNTGTVIPPDKLDRIFDRFFQLEGTLTREHGGAGLGLSIVRGMVAVCGGKVSVKSTEQVGTTFTLTVPLDNSDVEVRKLVL